jgi:hypothetical protein
LHRRTADRRAVSCTGRVAGGSHFPRENRKACESLIAIASRRRLYLQQFKPIFNEFLPRINANRRLNPGLGSRDQQARTGRISEKDGAGGACTGKRFMGRSLSDTIRELSRTFACLRDEYRPELHYMRGPGPKWHAKHSGSGVSAEPARTAQAATLFKTAKVHA